MQQAEELVLTVPEVARRLRVNPRTVYGLIERGELRVIRVGRLFRIPAADLQRYLQGQQRPGDDTK